MLGELQRFEPGLTDAVRDAVEGASVDLGMVRLRADAFDRAHKISIDYAVMERTGLCAVIEADMGWSDIGTWQAVWERSERDALGNAVRGTGVILDSRNVHIRSEDVLTAVVGLDDVVVVATHDAVLVLNRAHAGKVKDLVEHLKALKPPSTAARTGRGATTRASTGAPVTRSSASW